MRPHPRIDRREHDRAIQALEKEVSDLRSTVEDLQRSLKNWKDIAANLARYARTLRNDRERS